jgi:hypothetical protein
MTRREGLLAKGVAAAVALAAGAANCGIEIRCDHPGGNVRVGGVDETNGVVRVAPDLRSTRGKWFHFDFKARGAAGRTIRFQFPEDGATYLSSLGPAVSRDGGGSWRWLRADGGRHEPKNRFDYSFAADEVETRFAFSIPYVQKDWDAASARWRGRDGVKFGVLCKSQSGRRDTELLRIPCRAGGARWLFAFTARHHACETTGSYVLEGVVDEILSGSREGRWIRGNADCVIVPFMDKDGVEEGDQGKNRRPHDHNRDYLAGLYASTRAFKELLVRESNGKRIVFFDLHAPGPRDDNAYTLCDWLPEKNARWRAFRRNFEAAQKGGALAYAMKRDSTSSRKSHYSMISRGLMTSRGWVGALPNCWMSVCGEFGYSRSGGAFSRSAGRELGGSLLRAAVHTVEGQTQGGAGK